MRERRGCTRRDSRYSEGVHHISFDQRRVDKRWMRCTVSFLKHRVRRHTVSYCLCSMSNTEQLSQVVSCECARGVWDVLYLTKATIHKQWCMIGTASRFSGATKQLNVSSRDRAKTCCWQSIQSDSCNRVNKCACSPYLYMEQQSFGPTEQLKLICELVPSAQTHAIDSCFRLLDANGHHRCVHTQYKIASSITQ